MRWSFTASAFTAGGARRVTLGYSPATSTWTRLALGPRPILAQEGDVAVWTGSEMLVLGMTSAAYNPVTNAWRPVARAGPPSQIAGWTGHEAIVWDSGCCGGTSRTAEAYNPAT
jgi:hypothetical protein